MPTSSYKLVSKETIGDASSKTSASVSYTIASQPELANATEQLINLLQTQGPKKLKLLKQNILRNISDIASSLLDGVNKDNSTNTTHKMLQDIRVYAAHELLHPKITSSTGRKILLKYDKSTNQNVKLYNEPHKNVKRASTKEDQENTGSNVNTSKSKRVNAVKVGISSRAYVTSNSELEDFKGKSVVLTEAKVIDKQEHEPGLEDGHMYHLTELRHVKINEVGQKKSNTKKLGNMKSVIETGLKPYVQAHLDTKLSASKKSFSINPYADAKPIVVRKITDASRFPNTTPFVETVQKYIPTQSANTLKSVKPYIDTLLPTFRPYDYTGIQYTKQYPVTSTQPNMYVEKGTLERNSNSAQIIKNVLPYTEVIHKQEHEPGLNDGKLHATVINDSRIGANTFQNTKTYVETGVLRFKSPTPTIFQNIAYVETRLNDKNLNAARTTKTIMPYTETAVKVINKQEHEPGLDDGKRHTTGSNHSSSIANKLQNVNSNVETGVMYLKSPISTRFQNTAYVKTRLPSNISQVDTDLNPVHINTVVDKQHIVPYVKSVLSKTNPYVEAVLPNVNSYVETALPKVIPYVEAVLPKVNPYVETVLPNVTRYVETVLPNMNSYVETALPKVNTYVESVLLNVNPYVETVLPKVNPYVEAVLPKVNPYVETVLPNMNSYVETALPKVIPYVEAVLPKVNPYVETVLPNVTRYVETVLPNMNSYVETALPKVNTYVESVLPNVNPYVEAVLPKVNPYVETVLPNVNPYVEAVLPKVNPYVEAVLPKVNPYVETVLNGVHINAVKGLQNALPVDQTGLKDTKLYAAAGTQHIKPYVDTAQKDLTLYSATGIQNVMPQVKIIMPNIKPQAKPVLKVVNNNVSKGFRNATATILNDVHFNGVIGLQNALPVFQTGPKDMQMYAATGTQNIKPYGDTVQNDLNIYSVTGKQNKNPHVEHILPNIKPQHKFGLNVVKSGISKGYQNATMKAKNIPPKVKPYVGVNVITRNATTGLKHVKVYVNNGPELIKRNETVRRTHKLYADSGPNKRNLSTNDDDLQTNEKNKNRNEQIHQPKSIFSHRPYVAQRRDNEDLKQNIIVLPTIKIAGKPEHEPGQPECLCSNDDMPVCGSDGKTYGNSCFLACT